MLNSLTPLPLLLLLSRCNSAGDEEVQTKTPYDKPPPATKPRVQSKLVAFFSTPDQV